MIRTFTTIVWFVLLGSMAFGQRGRQSPAGASQRSVEQTLRALSDQWEQVVMTRDVGVLKRIWASDFLYVEPSGRTFNKDEGMADVAKMTDQPTSAQITSFKVRVYNAGTAAVTIGDARELGRDKDGKAFDRRSRFTNVWVLQNGSWQCVSGHSSDLPAK